MEYGAQSQYPLLCHCGCRGWCSLRPFFGFLKWSLEGAAHGLRPQERWDRSKWPDGSSYADMPMRMKARYVVIDVRGDWSEHCATFGLTTWQSINRP
eukprot:9475352-Pyramimonas_sp.AAC.1